MRGVTASRVHLVWLVARVRLVQLVELAVLGPSELQVYDASKLSFSFDDIMAYLRAGK